MRNILQINEKNNKTSVEKNSKLLKRPIRNKIEMKDKILEVESYWMDLKAEWRDDRGRVSEPEDRLL